MTDGRPMTVANAAKAIGVSTRTIRRWIERQVLRAGKGPGLTSPWRIMRVDVTRLQRQLYAVEGLSHVP